ncbi:MAG: multiheme c-type cytochrome [Candidatus Bathyarchaeia archaeon]
MKSHRSRIIASLAVIVILLGSTSLMLRSYAETSSLKVSDFEDPNICGGCHDQHYSEWQRSQHAEAQVDRLYLAEYDQASKDTGGLTDPFCTKCHSPISYLAGEIPVTSELGMRGVSCDFCHTVTGTTDTGNGAFENSPGKIKRGPLKDPSASGYHESAYSELHRKSEFCAMCHVVNHPVNGLPIMTTYQEWRESPYSAEGITCQHCMMVPTKGKAAVTGNVRDEVFGHVFLGGHHEYNLKRAARLSLQVSSPVTAGGNMTILANVTNSGCGHALPTGVSEVRELWLEVTVKDPSGKLLYEGRRYYRPVFVDEKGEDVGPLFWRAVRILSDNRIAPGETRTETFSFSVPPDTALPIKVDARLLYRLAPQEVADKAGLGLLPVTVMAQAEVSAGFSDYLGVYGLPAAIVAVAVAASAALLILKRKRRQDT